MAQSLDIAPPSASYQIGVLRDGKYVLHLATALARGLLDNSGA